MFSHEVLCVFGLGIAAMNHRPRCNIGLRGVSFQLPYYWGSPLSAYPRPAQRWRGRTTAPFGGRALRARSRFMAGRTRTTQLWGQGWRLKLVGPYVFASTASPQDCMTNWVASRNNCADPQGSTACCRAQCEQNCTGRHGPVPLEGQWVEAGSWGAIRIPTVDKSWGYETRVRWVESLQL